VIKIFIILVSFLTTKARRAQRFFYSHKEKNFVFSVSLWWI